MNKFFVVSLLFAALIPLRSSGQFLNSRTNVPVFVDGDFLGRPWEGGFNQPQFSMADLDQDGEPELIIYDRQGLSPEVFRWNAMDQQWEWLPGKGQSFPVANDWMLVRDVNCDSWPDILMSHPDTSGVRLWLGTGRYQWMLDQSLLAADGKMLYVLRTDIPAITDIDNDGDDDILTFDEAGSFVVWYERLNDCDSVAFTMNSLCWGQFSEAGLNNQIFLNTSCLNGDPDLGPESGGGHAGSTLAAPDVDGDGLPDLLIGDLNQNTITYLHNGGTKAFAVMDAIEVPFPSGPQAVQVRKFPATWPMDIDQDGDTDLLVSPNDPVAGRNVNQIWLYKNQSQGAWNLIRSGTDWLVGDMIDVGERSKPALTDVNGDGLLDLVIGNFTSRSGNDGGTSGLACFLNTGTSHSPAFDLISSDWLSIGSLFNPAIFGLSPSFGDIDLDGDEDLVLGDADGHIHLFLNQAAPGNSMQLQLFEPNFLGLDVGNSATPTIADLDLDGKADLVVGSENGTLTWLHNASTIGSNIQFQPPFSDMGQLSAHNLGSLAPWFRQDSMGAWELWLGTSQGQLRRYMDITPNLSGGAFTLIDSSFGDLPLIPYLAPAILDLDANGNLDLLIGNQKGGLYWYEETDVNGISQAPLRRQASWTVQQASNGEIRLITKAPLSFPARYWIMDLNGRLLSGQALPAGFREFPVQLSSLPQGVYIIRIIDQRGFWHKKILLNN